jgi:hypothetical protein
VDSKIEAKIDASQPCPAAVELGKEKNLSLFAPLAHAIGAIVESAEDSALLRQTLEPSHTQKMRSSPDVFTT